MKKNEVAKIYIYIYKKATQLSLSIEKIIRERREAVCLYSCILAAMHDMNVTFSVVAF